MNAASFYTSRKIFFSIILIILCPFILIAHQADLIIFSYDRPMQLFSFLESIEKYVTNVHDTRVIYRASTQAFQDAYQEVQEYFPYVMMIRQPNSNPRQNFKPLTVHATFDGGSPYVLFAVDDIVVKDFVDLSKCIELLEKYNAYGFYLRLGRNLTYCYSEGRNQPLPIMREVEDGVYAWQFSHGIGDWGYPHSVDMTIMRKKTIQEAFSSLDYTSPNTLEARWAGLAHHIMNQTGLCYARTKIVNVPLNRVQHDYNNRNMEAYSTMQLLDIFNAGNKIDIAPLHQWMNSGAHTPYDFAFIAR